MVTRQMLNISGYIKQLIHGSQDLYCCTTLEICNCSSIFNKGRQRLSRYVSDRHLAEMTRADPARQRKWILTRELAKQHSPNIFLRAPLLAYRHVYSRTEKIHFESPSLCQSCNITLLSHYLQPCCQAIHSMMLPKIAGRTCNSLPDSSLIPTWETYSIWRGTRNPIS